MFWPSKKEVTGSWTEIMGNVNYRSTYLNKTTGSEGKGHTQRFVWHREWATLHSSGCLAQGTPHLHVSWQQVVPLCEKQQC